MDEIVSRHIKKIGEDQGLTEPIDMTHEQLFPAKLHGLIEMLEKDDLNDICSFQPHGRAFFVRDKKRFVDTILPKWFQQHRWTSFQRQLNIYNFKRITRGPDSGSYYHPHFLRGRRDLCRFIQRVGIKGYGRRKPARPELEPDFYSYKPLGQAELEDEKVSTTASAQLDKSPAAAVVEAAQSSTAFPPSASATSDLSLLSATLSLADARCLPLSIMSTESHFLTGTGYYLDTLDHLKNVILEEEAYRMKQLAVASTVADQQYRLAYERTSHEVFLQVLTTRSFGVTPGNRLLDVVSGSAEFPLESLSSFHDRKA